MSDIITASIEYQMYDDWGNFHGVRNVERFDAETTRQILDTLPVSSIELFIEEDTSNEEGDGFYHSAEAMALADNHYGDSFSVYIYADEDEYRAYLADRRERGIPEDGVKIDMQAFHLRAKIKKINDLIESLPDDGSVLWLSTDESWGGAADLSIYHRDDLSEDVLDAYEIDLTSI